MEEVIWVEVLTRGGEVAMRHRCAGSELRIGRDYTNDVIVDDPYVAPRHLRLTRDAAGAFVAEAEPGAGGLYLGGSREPVERAVIGTANFRIGRTSLRARDATQPVAPARRLPAPTRVWPLAVALLVAILGVEVLGYWLRDVGEFRGLRYAVPLIGIVVVVLGWTAAWSVLTRIFAGHMHFERNLLIASAAVLGYSLFNEVVEVLPFTLSWTGVTSFQFVGFWLAIGTACFFHLREIGPARLGLKGGLVSAAVLLAVAVQTIGLLDRPAFFRADAMRLMPPGFRVAPAQDEAAFFRQIGAIKAKLDVDRTKRPLQGFDPFALFDDDDDDD